jgi:hypothetical protein
MNSSDKVTELDGISTDFNKSLEDHDRDDIEADDVEEGLSLQKLSEIENSETVKRLASLFQGVKMPDKQAKMKIRDKGPIPTKISKEDYGLDIRKLKNWSREINDERLQGEEAKQEFALAQMKSFVDAIGYLVKIQTWWRKIRIQAQFKRWKADRNIIRSRFFGGWKTYYYAEKMRNNIVCGKPFRAWMNDVLEQKRLNTLALEFFKLSIARSRLSYQSVMVFFNPQGWTKVITESDISKIRRLILYQLLIGWRTTVTLRSVSRFKALQHLTRAIRKIKGPLWSNEVLLVAFQMWNRYGKVLFIKTRNILHFFRLMTSLYIRFERHFV